MSLALGPSPHFRGPVGLDRYKTVQRTRHGSRHLRWHPGHPVPDGVGLVPASSRRRTGAYPTEVEAVWQLAEDRYVYIIEDTERAGGAVSMIWFDDPASEVARIAMQGLEPVDVEKHDRVWKYVFHDTDGNEIGIGGAVSPQD